MDVGQVRNSGIDGKLDLGEVTHQHQVFEQVRSAIAGEVVTLLIRLHDTVVIQLGQDAVRHDDTGPVSADWRF